MGWRYSLVVRHTGFSSKGPRFDSQYPDSHLQTVTPVPGDVTPSPDLQGQQACTHGKQTQMQAKHPCTYNNNNNVLSKREN